MSYSKETIKHLADSLGLSVKDFEAQFKDEKQHEVKIPEPKKYAKVFETQQDFDTYNENLKSPEYGRGIDDGKKNATEVFIKGIRDHESLDITGSQLNQEQLLSALKNKYGSDNKSLIEQFDRDKAGLLQKNTDLESEYASKFQTQNNEIKRMKLRGESLDGVKLKTKFNKIDGVDLIMKDVTIEKDAAGKEFIHYKGVQQKDDKLEPLSMAQITDTIYIDKKWYAEDEGRGGGNASGNGTTNDYKDFLDEMDEKNIHQGSAVYQDELNKRLEDKDFKKSVAEAN